VCLHVSLCDLFDCTEGLAPIFETLDVRDFPAVDPEMTLTPRCDVYFKLVTAKRRDELLDRCSFSDGQFLIRFPVKRR
jgi:hypothetical protein